MSQFQEHYSSAYSPLLTELDKWDETEQRALFWWRDDDAATANPQLRSLLEVADHTHTNVAIAVDPKEANSSLTDLLTGQSCCVWQHGWNHDLHSTGEFGADRLVEELIVELLDGQLALDRLFGPTGWQHILVMPRQALSGRFKLLLPLLGYAGVSLEGLGDGYPPTPQIKTVPEINTSVDVIDWSRSTFIGAEALCQSVVKQLEHRRMGLIRHDTPIGLLTHHIYHRESDWEVFRALIELLQSHTASQFLSAKSLFSLDKPVFENVKDPSEVSSYRPGEVTVVVTSCGRHDLLKRTLDSFFQFNTHPVRKIIVIEDGAQPKIEHLKRRYRDQPIVWTETTNRIGQIRAIDMAYRLIDTEYFFHCEDDWEFYRSGFIEDSMKILKAHDSILKVWIRPLKDLDRGRSVNYRFGTAEVPFYIITDGEDGNDAWTWHPFNFNPGLHRTRDYQLIGSYGSVDLLNELMSGEVEQAVCTLYRALGFHSALVGNDVEVGYVKHIGEYRHVAEPVANYRAPMTFREHTKDLVPSLGRALKWRFDRLIGKAEQ